MSTLDFPHLESESDCEKSKKDGENDGNGKKIDYKDSLETIAATAIVDNRSSDAHNGGPLCLEQSKTDEQMIENEPTSEHTLNQDKETFFTSADKSTSGDNSNTSWHKQSHGIYKIPNDVESIKNTKSFGEEGDIYNEEMDDEEKNTNGILGSEMATEENYCEIENNDSTSKNTELHTDTPDDKLQDENGMTDQTRYRIMIADVPENIDQNDSTLKENMTDNESSYLLDHTNEGNLNNEIYTKKYDLEDMVYEEENTVEISSSKLANEEINRELENTESTSKNDHSMKRDAGIPDEEFQDENEMTDQTTYQITSGDIPENIEQNDATLKENMTDNESSCLPDDTNKSNLDNEIYNKQTSIDAGASHTIVTDFTFASCIKNPGKSSLKKEDIKAHDLDEMVDEEEHVDEIHFEIQNTNNDGHDTERDAAIPGDELQDENETTDRTIYQTTSADEPENIEQNDDTLKENIPDSGSSCIPDHTNESNINDEINNKQTNFDPGASNTIVDDITMASCIGNPGELQLKLEEMKKYDLTLTRKCSPTFTAAAFISDDIIILCDNCGHTDSCGFLAYFNMKYEYIFKVEMNKPFGICHLNEREIAVSVPNDMMIHVTSVQDYRLTVKASYETKREPLSLVALRDNQLGITWRHPPSLEIVKINGNDLLAVKLYTRDSSGRRFKSFRYVAIDEIRKHIIQPCHVDNAVYCFNYSAEPVFEYRDPSLDGPYGVDIDQSGKVYICSRLTDTIHVLSPTGCRLSIITNNVPSCPQTIQFDRSGERLVMTAFDNYEDVHLCRISPT